MDSGWKKAVIVGAVVAVPVLGILLRPGRKAHRVGENGEIVLMDLDKPLLPWKLRVLNLVLGPFVGKSAPTMESVLGGVVRETGLSDFGDEERFPFREGMGKFMEDLEREYPKLTPLGRMSTLTRIKRVLRSRLEVVDLVKRHPEILEEDIKDPIVIVGPPRSGTTHWHCSLAHHEAFRTLKAYELNDPVMSDEIMDAIRKEGEDPRWALAKRSWSMLLEIRPFFQHMHDVSHDSPEEDIVLMASTFQSLGLSGFVPCENYMSWRQEIDETPGLELLKLCLQVIQWQDTEVGRPIKRFVLKAPGHMNSLKWLVKVFPDAKFLQTYREPKDVFASITYLLCYIYGIIYKEVDLKQLSQIVLASVLEMYSKHRRDQEVIRDRSFVANFSDYQLDNAGYIKKVLDFVGEESDEEHMKPILEFLSKSQRFNRGRIRYEPSIFGWNEEELEQQFSGYENYLV